MTRKIVERVKIPRCEGQAVEVLAGQVVRIIATEGPQVADTAFLALDNPRGGVSRRAISGAQHVGGHRHDAPTHSSVFATSL